MGANNSKTYNYDSEKITKQSIKHKLDQLFIQNRTSTLSPLNDTLGFYDSLEQFGGNLNTDMSLGRKFNNRPNRYEQYDVKKYIQNKQSGGKQVNSEFERIKQFMKKDTNLQVEQNIAGDGNDMLGGGGGGNNLNLFTTETSYSSGITTFNAMKFLNNKVSEVKEGTINKSSSEEAPNIVPFYSTETTDSVTHPYVKSRFN